MYLRVHVKRHGRSFVLLFYIRPEKINYSRNDFWFIFQMRSFFKLLMLPSLRNGYWVLPPNRTELGPRRKTLFWNKLNPLLCSTSDISDWINTIIKNTTTVKSEFLMCFPTLRPSNERLHSARSVRVQFFAIKIRRWWNIWQDHFLRRANI